MCKTRTSGIFDNNAYANDPRTQFMNWALMANEAWDYPADAIGYTTGLAELNQPKWTLRYGFFQVPRFVNGLTTEDRLLKWPYESSSQDGPLLDAWVMVTEFERRYSVNTHRGAIRFLAYGACLIVTKRQRNGIRCLWQFWSLFR